jgi:uncharacterized protein
MSPRPEDTPADRATTGEAPGSQTPGSPGADGPPGAGGLPGADSPGADSVGADSPGADRPGESSPGPGGRDRDAAGRARNARPRDALGRPLPRGATGDERIPDDLVLPPTQALQLAQELLDSGRPFHAHEVLEASWKSAPAAERDLWQGLAQIAVGLTHARRGNAAGASALLRRGADRVAGYAGAPPHGIDAAGICRAAREMAARIDRDGAGAAGPLTARLVAASP